MIYCLSDRESQNGHSNAHRGFKDLRFGIQGSMIHGGQTSPIHHGDRTGSTDCWFCRKEHGTTSKVSRVIKELVVHLCKLSPLAMQPCSFLLFSVPVSASPT